MKFSFGLNKSYVASMAMVAVGAAFFFTIGCATIPGKTKAEQAETIDQLVTRTLADLYKQNPETKEAIAQCVGYVIMNNKITKIPVVGVGAGYGVAIDAKTGKQTYLKMGRFDVGGGWGARSLRPVVIFRKEKAFKDLLDGKWIGNMGAEAAAKVGDTGVAGSGGADNLQADKGYTMYALTDAGVSATVTAGVIRIKPVKLK